MINESFIAIYVLYSVSQFELFGTRSTRNKSTDRKTPSPPKKLGLSIMRIKEGGVEVEAESFEKSIRRVVFLSCYVCSLFVCSSVLCDKFTLRL